MRERLPALLLVPLLALAGCGGATSTTSLVTSRASDPASQIRFASATSGDLTLSQGWVVAPEPGMAGMTGGPESTAYAVVADSGPQADRLVSVTSGAARRITLHSTVTSANGSAGTMESVSGIGVPAGGQVVLTPGGYHVMLLGLTGRLAEGSRITMTWTFASGRAITTTFPVINREDRPDA